MEQNAFAASHRHNLTALACRVISIVHGKVRDEHHVVYELEQGEVQTMPVFSFLWQFAPLTPRDAIVGAIDTFEAAQTA